MDYFRCGDCGHVWNTPKAMFNGQRVTPTPVAVPCPECGACKTDCLSDLSAMMDADFLRCGTCGHVWMLPRGKGEPPCDVEPRRA